MKRHLAALARAHEALLSARPTACERALGEFEALCRRTTPDQETLLLCQKQLHALEQMTQGGIRGVADARRVLLEAIEAANQLSTYDARGERATRLDHLERRGNGPAY